MRSDLFSSVCLALAAALLASGSGCRRVPPGGDLPSTPATEQAMARLAMVPAGTKIVLAVDLATMRSHAIWTPLLSLLSRQPRPTSASLPEAGPFDPLRQVSQVLFALPGLRERDDRFMVLADTESPPDPAGMAWLRERLGKDATATVRNHNQIVLAQGAWAFAPAVLADGPRLRTSAADDPEMARLCAKSAGNHLVWIAAVVPASLRKAMAAESLFPDLGAIARLHGFLDFDGGVHAEISAELASSEDAAHLAHRLMVYLNQAKRHPNMLVSGFSPFFDNVHLAAKGAHVRATVDIPASQAADFAQRIEALADARFTK